jgi:hypothetical protein
MSEAKLTFSQPYNFEHGTKGVPDTRRFHSEELGFGYIQAIDHLGEWDRAEAWAGLFFESDDLYGGVDCSFSEFKELLEDDEKLTQFIKANTARY